MAENKQYVSQVQDNGRIMISEEVIATITVHALKEVDGVVGLSAKPGADIVEVIGRKNRGKGIAVAIGEQDEITVTCNVILGFGHSIIGVSNAIQTAVMNAVESTTGLTDIQVNVNVCGIIRK